jgi:glycosyltransferase involved in cell wall biosynthesis
MRVIVASARPPFVRGGTELLANELVKALLEAGHQADLVEVPFNLQDPERIADQMLACALMNMQSANGDKVDRLVALKFPAYLIQHPNKVVWLVHQYRAAYDLWDHSLGGLREAPRGGIVRDMVHRADAKMRSEAKALFTISANVSRRVRRFWNVDALPLHHPPPAADAFYCADEVEDYVFFPSRLSRIKRQDLALRALALTRAPIRMKFAGAADEFRYRDTMERLARELGIDSRVEWMSFISDETKRATYARAFAVLFPPIDEDYGYVTLEAMLASKPVITCDDAGGPLEFLVPGETGVVTSPTPEAVATAMDMLWENANLAKQMGRAGRKRYDSLGLSWPRVLKQLLA